MGRAPDPRGIASSSEFVAQLRRLKVWAGNPSFEQLARSSGVPRSTLADALSKRSTRLPALDVVRRFVRACGVAGDHAQAWEQRWRQLRAAVVAAPSAEDLPAGGGGPPIPRQLPSDVNGFVGRAEMISALDGMLTRDGEGDSVLISAMCGTAGVGKTALAVRWARRVADEFPDGQLYVNLRGYHSGPPMRPIEALAQLLLALGTPPDQVPVEPAPAAGLYRSLLADRRVLVLLDNAADPEQVRPLLPGSPGCLVLVTSRDQLSGLVALDGARRLTLDRLSEPEAISLLRELLGVRVDAELDAAAALVDRCVGLPLALRIAAAQLADHPHQRLATYVEQLDADDRLAALQIDGDPQAAVRAAFDLSYHRLTPDQQRLFRLLGLVPGPDVTAETAAALADTTGRQASRLLDRLTAAHLLEQHAPGRYTFHDLLRAYALERAHDTDGKSDRQAAARRLYDHYLANADAAARLLYPELVRLPLPAYAGRSSLPDHAQALAWLEAERAGLVAAITHTAAHGPLPVAWRLADTLRGYLSSRMYTVEFLAVTQAGVAAAEADGDLCAQAAARLSLGQFHWHQSQHQLALDECRRAMELSQRSGWTEGQAAAHSNLGLLYRHLGQLQHATDSYAHAIAANMQIKRAGGLATNLLNLGLVQRDQGRLRQAADCHIRALAIYQEIGSIDGEAATLSGLAETYRELGRYDEALHHLTRARTRYRQIGNLRGDPDVISLLASVHRDAGRYDRAAELADAAVAGAHEDGDLDVEAQALGILADIQHGLGSHQQAVDHHQRALQLALGTRSCHLEVCAHFGLATSLCALGQQDQALNHAQQALNLARKAGYRVREGQALTALAAIHLAQGRPDLAIRHAEQALASHRETGHRLGEARAGLILGDALVHTGDIGLARQHRQQALELFEDLGTPEAAQARAHLVPVRDALEL